MKKIPLTRGVFALVDDADFDTLSRVKWCAYKAPNTMYAVRDTWVNGKKKFLRMHRVILGDAATGLQVDHRDGDGLNNQRSNLRACTQFENMRNQGVNKLNTTGLKGVSIERRRTLASPYRAQIRINGKIKNLGNYQTPELAYAAYCAAAIELQGEFVRLA